MSDMPDEMQIIKEYRLLGTSPMALAERILKSEHGTLSLRNSAYLNMGIAIERAAMSAEVERLRGAIVNVSNSLKLMAFTSAWKDNDLSTFLAIQAGTLEAALAGGKEE